MATPLTKKRWNILLDALSNYYYHRWETTVIPKGLPQAFHDQRHWYEYYWSKQVFLQTISLTLTTSLEDTRIWAIPSYSIANNPFTKSLLNSFQNGTNQTWNASHPSGSLPPGISPPSTLPLQAPWPTVTTRIDKSTIQGVMESIHWSPLDFPYFYRVDFYDQYQSYAWGYKRWMDGLYETVVTIDNDDEDQGGGNHLLTVTNVYTTTLKTMPRSSIQVFQPNLIHNAKLQWIAPAYNRTLGISCDYDDSQEDLIQYVPINPNTSPWGYEVLAEITVNDDGTCDLPYLTHVFQYTSTREIQTHIGAFVSYSYTESGVSTNEKQHAWVLNLDNAEFI